MPIQILGLLAQRFLEALAIAFVQNDRFPAIAPSQRVVNGALILDSHFSRHDTLSRMQ